MKHQAHSKTYLRKLIDTLEVLDHQEIEKVIDIIASTINTDRTIFLFGNGGSASTASHIASDLNKGTRTDKQILRAMALTDNLAVIMAYANDMHYDDVFIEQLKNFMKSDDVVVGISGSGNSKNVIKAIEHANKEGAITIGITGYNGGKLKQISAFSINANVDDMEMSEDVHLIISHIIKRALMK